MATFARPTRLISLALALTLAILGFTNSAAPLAYAVGGPVATTNAPSVVTDSTATLNGIVNANGASTTVTFQYGLTTGYGTTVTATPSPVTGSTNTAVSKAITGLSAKTVYHYRVVGVNGSGTTNGLDQTFTTGSVDDFVITVKTNNSGSSTSTQFLIPTTGSGYNYNVDCNSDGTNDATAQTGNYTCNYSATGTYTLRIKDNSGALTGFPRIYFNNGGDRLKLLTIAKWGQFKWTSMASAFYGCNNLTSAATDSPDLSGVTDTSYMFAAATMFNANIGGWDTSHVTNMSYMFDAATVFNANIGSWNTGHVTTMSYMFHIANAFNQNLSGWDTSQVTDMSYMFEGANMFNQNLGGWNVTALTNATGMFASAGLSSTNYDALLTGWDAQTLHNGVPFGGGTFYCAGQSARAHIISTYAWTITDKGRWCPAEEFAMTVKTNQVTAGVKTFTIPTTGSGYNYNVDCNNDGTLEATGQTGDYVCTYAIAGTYTIRIRDNSGAFTGFPRIYFYSTGDGLKLLAVTQWGMNKWASMESAFYRCSNLSITATDSPDLSGVTDMSNMFNQASTLNSNIGGWDTSHVTNMSYLFYQAGAFNGNIGSWNTGNVANMSNMFYSASAFNQNIGSWDTSHVTDMSHMFDSATAFNQNIGGWNTGSVTTMASLFSGASAFNGNISGWDTSQVTDMSSMFIVDPVFNQNIGSWNTGNVTTTVSMFSGATAFNQDIGGWDTSQVIDMTSMFMSAKAFNQDIGGWNTSNVTVMQSMFYNATAFNQNLNWDTSHVTQMGLTFMSATAFNGDISGWNTGNVTSMAGMFRGATAFNGNLSTWDIHSATNIGQMFYGASAFNQNIGGWNTANMVNMGSTFYNATAFNQNISSWNTAKVTNMQGMFYNATAFNQNIGGWDTSQVSNMSYLFSGARAFNQDLSGWNTGNVTNMSSMFYNATAFNRNLGGWNVTNLGYADSMFSGATLSTTNYDALLNGWGAQVLQSDVYLDGGNSKYCLGAAARATMYTTYNWTVTDGGTSCAPSVTTDSATVVTDSSATLNGTVGANGASTTVTFEYGLTTGYGTSVTADQSPVTVGGNTAVSKAITGLTSGTPYHYRVVGVSANGTTNGSDQTFTTTTGPTICEVTVSGNWSVVTVHCLPGEKILISAGVTVDLNNDIELSGDLEIQGTLNPNNKTVTLTGSAAQTLTGNPLTFYTLVINKTNKTDTVTSLGKLKVTKKLTITKGKLKSASDYGDVEIGTEGSLELTNDITVGGTWINNGEFIANTAQVAFDGTEPQAISGTHQTLFQKLVISPTAGVFITTTPAVTDTVTNYGVLSQTQTVGPNGSVAFLQISTNKYQGLTLVTDAFTDIGEVTVAIRGNAAQCTSDAGSPAYRQRCFRITSARGEVAPNITLYTTAAEDPISGDDIYQYIDFIPRWASLSATCGSNPGDACSATGVSLNQGDNYFLIGGVEAPNAVTLKGLTASASPIGTAPMPILLATLLGLGGLFIALRRSATSRRHSQH